MQVKLSDSRLGQKIKREQLQLSNRNERVKERITPLAKMIRIKKKQE
jgi:hypothetical protein